MPGDGQYRLQPAFVTERAGRLQGLGFGGGAGIKVHGVVHGRISTPWIVLLSRLKAVRKALLL